MAYSNFLKNLVKTHLYRTGSWTKPTELWLALFTTKPAVDGTGGVEVSGGSYARVQLDPLDANWSLSVDTISNAVVIQYPEASADWGTVVAFGVFSASTAGNLLDIGDVTPNQAVPSGVAAKFEAGQLTSQLT
jgi:hypothetical protein